MDDIVIDVLVIFSIIGFLIYFKGFQSNLDVLSITLIYVIFSGFLIGIYVFASGLINFIDWFLGIAEKNFIKSK